MCLPNRPTVKCIQRLLTSLHVVEPTQPDELICIIKIAKLTDDLHSHSLLRFYKFTVKEFNQRITLPGVKCVLTQLDDGGVCLCFHVHVLFLFATEGTEPIE